MYSDRSVPPVEIRQQGLADGRKILRRPGAVPGQLQDAAPHLRAPRDRGRLGQIKADVIVRVYLGLAEILHLARGLQARAPRGCFQRSQLDAGSCPG